MAPVTVRPESLTWASLEPGVTYAVLSVRPDGGVTTLTRFAAGTIGGWHSHPGGEELYVLQGKLLVAGEHLTEGGYMYTPPNGRHRVEAIEETLLLVILPQLPIYDERADS